MLNKIKTRLLEIEVSELSDIFASEQASRRFLESIRWPDGPCCPYDDCGHDKIFRFSNGRVYKCAKCERQFSIKTGTPFHDSRISLRKWFFAIWLIDARGKITSVQLGQVIGVTQKTAWRMKQTITGSKPRKRLSKAEEHQIYNNVLKGQGKKPIPKANFMQMLREREREDEENKIVSRIISERRRSGQPPLGFEELRKAIKARRNKNKIRH